ncbi:MAG: hypothetical protein MUO40_12845, partial [Anaerolineaceae bacterium]|nr:hypothetical protein [Anaerolineaceae bacterium]
MKKNVGLILTVTIMISTLLLSFTPLPDWVQAKPNPQGTRVSILYVTSGGGGACTSWADACSLQAALTAASVGDEIWVA